MGTIKVNKAAIIGLFALGGVSLVGVKVYNEFTETKDNEIGHENINLINSIVMDDDDFVILDIGNNLIVKTNFQEQKVKYCNKKDISLGIIVSSNAKTEKDIYDDVEYVKGFIAENKVNLPVYLNIDKIIENEKLNLEMKIKLIKDFLEKCSANHIYVGINGTDTNLQRVKEYCKITDYDAYLVMDSKEIKYDGTYNMYKDLDGKIIKLTALDEIITEKDLNNSEKFVLDACYEVQENDDLTDIALQSGLSLEELLDFNDLRKKEVKLGTKIRIPSVIAPSAKKITSSFEKLETPIRGCDVSYCQADNTNWDVFEENFDFVIIKCCQGTTLDDYFEKNAKNCNLNNIPMGVYCYNNYDLNNCSDLEIFKKNQEKQADFVLENLKNKTIDYPVYLDIEMPSGVSFKDRLKKEHVQTMLDIWHKEITAAGYTPGIYCNQDGLSNIENSIDYNLADKFELWIAGGDQYSIGAIDLNDVKPSSILTKREDINMVQSTDSAINTGSGDANGYLDINFSKVDYATAKTNLSQQENFEIKEYTRINPTSILAGILVGGCVFIGINKQRKKDKIKTK